MAAEESTKPEIRRAKDAESDELAELVLRVRLQNLGSIPAPLHDIDDTRRWMRDVALEQYDVWVADVCGAIVAMMALGRPDWIEHLYVDQPYTNRGLGSRFLELAKAELPGDIALWTFQSNLGAHRFYERHGFEAVQTTEGDNEEAAPDVRYLFRR